MPKNIDGVKKIKKKVAVQPKESANIFNGAKDFTSKFSTSIKSTVSRREERTDDNPFDKVFNDKPVKKLSFFDVEKISNWAENKKNKWEEKKNKKREYILNKKEVITKLNNQKEKNLRQRVKTEDQEANNIIKTRKAKAKLKAEKLSLKFKRKENIKKQKEQQRQKTLELKLQKQKEKLIKRKDNKIKNKENIKIRLNSIKQVVFNFFVKLKSQRLQILKFTSIIASILIIVILVLSFLVYKSNIPNDYKLLLIKKLPFPVALVDYTPVNYSLYLEDLRLLNDYYKQDLSKEQIDLEKINIKEVVLNKLIEKKILDNLAKIYHIKISDQDINEFFTKKANDSGDVEKFTEDIYNQYGLTADIFKQKVIYYEALYNKIKYEFITDDNVHKGAALRMNKVLKLVNKNTEEFESLARKYSEGMYALKGGDVGYVNIKNMNDSMKTATVGLEKNQVSEVIKEEDKYYIVKVYDKVVNRQGEEEYWIKMISINTNYSFDDYLLELKEDAKVWKLIQL